MAHLFVLGLSKKQGQAQATDATRSSRIREQFQMTPITAPNGTPCGTTAAPVGWIG